MLTKDDLKQIKEVVGDVVKPLEQRFDTLEQRFDTLEQRFDTLEQKVDGLAADVSEIKLDVADLKLETKAIHEIIETQSEDHEQRIARLEEQAGINN